MDHHNNYNQIVKSNQLYYYQLQQDNQFDIVSSPHKITTDCSNTYIFKHLITNKDILASEIKLLNLLAPTYYHNANQDISLFREKMKDKKCYKQPTLNYFYDKEICRGHIVCFTTKKVPCSSGSGSDTEGERISYKIFDLGTNEISEEKHFIHLDDIKKTAKSVKDKVTPEYLGGGCPIIIDNETCNIFVFFNTNGDYSTGRLWMRKGIWSTILHDWHWEDSICVTKDIIYPRTVTKEIPDDWSTEWDTWVNWSNGITKTGFSSTVNGNKYIIPMQRNNGGGILYSEDAGNTWDYRDILCCGTLCSPGQEPNITYDIKNNRYMMIFRGALDDNDDYIKLSYALADADTDIYNLKWYYYKDNKKEYFTRTLKVRDNEANWERRVVPIDNPNAPWWPPLPSMERVGMDKGAIINNIYNANCMAGITSDKNGNIYISTPINKCEPGSCDRKNLTIFKLSNINPNNEDILKPNPFLADETKTNEYISVCETDSHESTGYSSIIHFNDVNNKSRLALVYDFGHALGKFHLQGTENTTNLRLIELN